MGLTKELALTALTYLSREKVSNPITNIENNSIQPTETNSINRFPFFPIGADRYDVGDLLLFREYAYACIMKKAMNIAKGQPFVYKEFKKKTNEQPDHVFLKVLKNENIYGQSFAGILVLLVINLHLHKKAYWHIVKTKTVFGEILNEIRPLPSKYITPVYNKENTLIEYYEYNQEKRIRFEKDEIIEFCNFNPDSNTEGLAPIERFAMSLLTNREMQKYAMDLFKNGGNIDGFLSTEQQLNATQRSELTEAWQSKYTGAGNRHKTAVMDKGLTYEQMSTTPKELDFSVSETNMRNKIFVFFDVPPPVMNVIEGVVSNSTMAQKSFIENTIEPYAKIMIESKINNYFRKMYGDKFKFVLEYEMETDPAMQLKLKEFWLKFIKPEVIAEMDGFSEEDVKEVQEPIDATKEKEVEEVEK